MKKTIPIERWYPLPGDVIPPVKMATVKKLSREEIKQHWIKAGLEIPEKYLDKALERRNRDNSKAFGKLMNEDRV